MDSNATVAPPEEGICAKAAEGPEVEEVLATLAQPLRPSAANNSAAGARRLIRWVLGMAKRMQRPKLGPRLSDGHRTEEGYR